MPKFNRRSFLHMVGAASLAPAIPALPAQAAATGLTTHAQLLWAGLYERAGSASHFAHLTKSLGVSTATATRLHAKLSSSRILVAESAVRARGMVRPAPQALKTPPAGKASPKRSLSNARKLLLDDMDVDREPIQPQDSKDQQMDDMTAQRNDFKT